MGAGTISEMKNLECITLFVERPRGFEEFLLGERRIEFKSSAPVERDPVTLLALATDLHPQRAVVVLQDVLSAHDQLALPGRGQGKASSASRHGGNNSASTGCPSVSQKGSGYRQMKSSSDSGLDETRTSGTLPPYLVSPFVRSGAVVDNSCRLPEPARSPDSARNPTSSFEL